MRMNPSTVAHAKPTGRGRSKICPHHVVGLTVSNGSIAVGVQERSTVHDSYVRYTLDRRLHVTEVSFFDAPRGLHRELEQTRVLDHRLTEEEVARASYFSSGKFSR